MCKYKKWNKVKSLSRVRLFVTPWTVAYQAPPSMGFSRQKCWSGLPFPSPRDLPNPGIEPGSPTFQAKALPYEPPGKPTTQIWNWEQTMPQIWLHYSLKYLIYISFLVSFKFNSVAQSCLTLCDPIDCSKPGLPVHHQLPELAQTHVHWVSDAIQPSYPLSSPSPPAFNLSQHQGNESVLHIRWPKYWSFNFSISPSTEYSGLTSFRMDWLDFLAVQRTLKSLLQHHIFS